MLADEVKRIIEEKLPGAQVHIRDFTGGGDHLEANIIWSGFDGMTRLKQHRAVYDALEGLVGGNAPVHALTLKTWSSPPDELANPAQGYAGAAPDGPSE